MHTQTHTHSTTTTLGTLLLCEAGKEKSASAAVAHMQVSKLYAAVFQEILRHTFKPVTSFAKAAAEPLALP